MELAVVADGTDLAGTEGAGDADAQLLLDQLDVMVRYPEQPLATTVAGEQQPARCRPDTGDATLQVLRRARAVAHLELHDLADVDQITHRDHARVRIHADHTADAEVAGVVVVLLVVHHQTDVQPPGAQQGTIGLLHLVDQLLEPFGRRFAAQLEDPVAFRSRDREGVADRTAAVRDDRRQRVRGQHDTHRTVLVDAIVEQQAGAFLPSRHQPPDDRVPRSLLPDPGHDLRGRERERIGQHQRHVIGIGVRPTGDGDAALGGGHRPRSEGFGSLTVQVRGPQAHRGARLHLLARPDDPLRHGTEEHLRLQPRLDGCDHRRHLVEVVGGDEHDDEVAPDGQPLPHGVGGFGGRDATLEGVGQGCSGTHARSSLLADPSPFRQTIHREPSLRSCEA